jgi:thioesterase domain-containing protein
LVSVRTAPIDTGEDRSGALVLVQAAAGYPPLFFVHGLGGVTPRFKNLVRHLGPGESVYVLREQDVKGEQPILTRIEDMAAQYVREIQTVQPKGPYFLVGYSFGGLISFEMAQQLHCQGHDVPLVAMIDSGQPIYRKDFARVLFSPKILRTYFRRLGELFTDAESRATFRSRIRNELCRLYLLKARGAAGLKGASRSLPRTETMLQAANIEAAVNFKPTPFTGRLSVFRVQERTVVDKFDRYLGWGGLAKDGVDVYDVPGNHVSATEEPHVRVLAENFKLAIRMARERSQSGSSGFEHPAIHAPALHGLPRALSRDDIRDAASELGLNRAELTTDSHARVPSP